MKGIKALNEKGVLRNGQESFGCWIQNYKAM